MQRLLELSERPSGDEIAAALGGLLAANRAIVKAWSVADLWRAYEALKQVVYRPRENPDRWSVITRILHERMGDCEDLAAAFCAVLERLMGPGRVAFWLTPGGSLRVFHCFVRVDGIVFDPSVWAGMGRAPGEIYDDPRAWLVG